MKILQINAIYGLKSTGRIVMEIHKQLKKLGHESYVAYSEESTADSNDTGVFRVGNVIDHKLHALLYRIDGKQAWHSKLSTMRLCRKIERINPDVVHLHNLHANYINLPILFSFLSKKNIPILITLHDCWFMTGGCMHYIYSACEQWKTGCENCPSVSKSKRQAYRAVFKEKKEIFDNVPVLAVNGVSKWTAEDAKKTPLFSEAAIIKAIYNWVDTSVFYPVDSKNEVIKKYNIDGSKKIAVCVSQSWSNNKGLDDITDIASELEDTLEIVLVGECRSEIDKKNVKPIGTVNNPENLRKIYSAADFLLNLSKAETFGLVMVEAMACGTPVVAYDNTGSSEIVNENCGILAESGNKRELIDGIKRICEKDKSYYFSHCVNYTKVCFEKEKQINKYVDLYSEMKKIKPEYDKRSK